MHIASRQIRAQHRARDAWEPDWPAIDQIDVGPRRLELHLDRMERREMVERIDLTGDGDQQPVS
jgi:hypothetical protein